MSEERRNEEKEKRWYVVNTYSGHENRVKENLERRLESMGIQDSLFRILVAEEPEIEIKNGKKVEKMKNLFPGYLFVEMIMTDEAWYVVRNTRGVTGFVGPGSKPVPLTDAEIKPLGIKTDTVSVDFLQFPYQTLLYHGGDCDDLSILNCSLFEALGIQTAFITIPGHIYMAYEISLAKFYFSAGT